MDQREFRVLIKHCFLMGKNTVQAEQWLQKCYPTSAPSKTTICRWYSEFKFGRTNTDDAERSGRPIEAVTNENIENVHQMVTKDHRIKVREIAETLKISKGSVGTILHKHLFMKKLCARWVPRLLSDEQKQHRIDDSEWNLAMFKRNPNEFIRRFVTMDETWIHHYTPESNKQSAEWLEPGQSRPKRPKTQTSAGKVMASVFWDAHGIILIDYLEKGKTINSEYYSSLLTRLDDEIKKNRPHLARKKVLYHQDNAPAHKSAITMAKLNDLRYELLHQPPYSPDLAPSDYYLFPNLKRWLQGKRFTSNDEVIAETNAYFEGLDKEYYLKGVQMLEDRWTKCIALKGDYVEE